MEFRISLKLDYRPKKKDAGKGRIDFELDLVVDAIDEQDATEKIERQIDEIASAYGIYPLRRIIESEGGIIGIERGNEPDIPEVKVKRASINGRYYDEIFFDGVKQAEIKWSSKDKKTHVNSVKEDFEVMLMSEAEVEEEGVFILRGKQVMEWRGDRWLHSN